MREAAAERRREPDLGKRSPSTQHADGHVVSAPTLLLGHVVLEVRRPRFRHPGLGCYFGSRQQTVAFHFLVKTDAADAELLGGCGDAPSGCAEGSSNDIALKSFLSGLQAWRDVRRGAHSGTGGRSEQGKASYVVPFRLCALQYCLRSYVLKFSHIPRPRVLLEFGKRTLRY